MKTISDLIQFLLTDEKSKESFQKLFLVYLDCIELSEKEEFRVPRPKFSVMMDKIVTSLKYNYPEKYSSGVESLLRRKARSFDESLARRASEKKDSNAFSEGVEASLSECIDCANELESELLELYSKLNSGIDVPFTFFNLYVPDKANREDAEKLIKSAIQIIQAESHLTNKAKQRITAHLEKALQTLKNGSNTDFFGVTKEVIAVLGALGSFTGGYIACLEQVKLQIREAQEIVEETSLNKTNISLNNCMEYIEFRLPSAEHTYEIFPLLKERKLIEGSLDNVTEIGSEEE